MYWVAWISGRGGHDADSSVRLVGAFGWFSARVSAVQYCSIRCSLWVFWPVFSVAPGFFQCGAWAVWFLASRHCGTWAGDKDPLGAAPGVSSWKKGFPEVLTLFIGVR